MQLLRFQKAHSYNILKKLKVKRLIFFVAVFYSLNPLLNASPVDTLPTPFGIKIDLSAESNKWRSFSSYNGNFSVLSPGEMTEKVDTVLTAMGELAYHIFFFQNKAQNADNVLYMLSYCDYPEGALHHDSTELLQDFFDVTLDAAAKSVKGELLYSNDIKIHGFPGKRWRIDYLNGEAIIKTKAFVRENRYYALQTITKKDRSLNFSADKFLDSFQFLNTANR